MPFVRAVNVLWYTKAGNSDFARCVAGLAGLLFRIGGGHIVRLRLVIATIGQYDLCTTAITSHFGHKEK